MAATEQEMAALHEEHQQLKQELEEQKRKYKILQESGRRLLREKHELEGKLLEALDGKHELAHNSSAEEKPQGTATFAFVRPSGEEVAYVLPPNAVAGPSEEKPQQAEEKPQPGSKRRKEN